MEMGSSAPGNLLVLPPHATTCYFYGARDSSRCLCHPPAGALMEIYGWCGVSASHGWDPIVPGVSRPPFQAQGCGEWSSTCSALVQEITMVGSASSPGEKAQARREKSSTGCPKARGLGVSPQTSTTSLGLDKTCLVLLPALQPLREATLKASLCILNHVKTIPGAQLPSLCLQKKAHRLFHAVNISLAILPSWL